MKMHSFYGVNDFVICSGYKGSVIKEYFANYFLHMSDVTFGMAINQMEVYQHNAEPCKVILVDVGDDTLMGGRLKRVSDCIKDESEFCFTHGDGDIDIGALIAFHRQHGKLATVTCSAVTEALWRIRHCSRHGHRRVGYGGLGKLARKRS